MYTIAELFDEAVRLHKSGNLDQADLFYRQVINADPGHAPAAHFLGLLAFQKGHPQAAETLLRRAIGLNPKAGGFHFNLGLVLKELGRLPEAAGCFQNELRLNPNHEDSHINLGMILVGQGQTVEAIGHYLQVLRINPNHADAHNNLGIARVLQNQQAEAGKCFQAALALDPNNANTHINLGNVLKDQLQFAEAVGCYREALRLKPDHANAHNNLGLALLGLNQLGEAIQSFRQALKLNPDYGNAYNNLGIALQDLDQTEEAIACYHEALKISPNNANALNNLGSALVIKGKLAEATDSYRQALHFNPYHADAYNNLGIALEAQGQLTEAIQSFEQTLAINPTHKMGLWNRACLRLLQGDFEAGWQGYEHRWNQPQMVPRLFSQPRWHGSPLEGKTILVHAEQGLGDTIQFARYLPMVRERGGTVIFECQPALGHLLAGVSGVDRLIAAGEALPPFDVQIPLLSLPGIFKTTLANIPANVPYVTADPKLVARWREILSTVASGSRLNKGLKIGIIWQGSMNQKGDRRSLSLPHFESLATIEGVQLVSLQVGPGTQQLAEVSFPVTDLGSRFDPNSLDDLAAAMKNVDLVITVDTAGAHLAGALGVPVWVALALAADWRYLLERSDNPWYPTMRLFRQSKLGDWGEVFERIASELGGLLV